MKPQDFNGLAVTRIDRCERFLAYPTPQFRHIHVISSKAAIWMAPKSAANRSATPNGPGPERNLSRNRQAPVPVRIGARQADTKLALFSWPGTARRATNRERLLFSSLSCVHNAALQGNKMVNCEQCAQKKLHASYFHCCFGATSTSHLVNFATSPKHHFH